MPAQVTQEKPFLSPHIFQDTRGLTGCRTSPYETVLYFRSQTSLGRKKQTERRGQRISERDSAIKPGFDRVSQFCGHIGARSAGVTRNPVPNGIEYAPCMRESAFSHLSLHLEPSAHKYIWEHHSRSAAFIETKKRRMEPTDYASTSSYFAACYPTLESFPPACCWSFIWRTLMR